MFVRQFFFFVLLFFFKKFFEELIVWESLFLFLGLWRFRFVEEKKSLCLVISIGLCEMYVSNMSLKSGHEFVGFGR